MLNKIVVSLCLLSLAAIGKLCAQEIVEERTIKLMSSSTKAFDLTDANLHAYVATWRTGARPTQLSYRYTDARHRFGEWQEWSLENHEPAVNASSLLLVPSTATRIEFRTKANQAVRVLAKAYRQDVARAQPTAVPQALAAEVCPCPSPAVITRATWCPTGDCVPAGSPIALTPEHVVVHHSAFNLGDADYRLAVRAIYDYHTGTNGWDDIGYHLLVAPDGTVYQGRDQTRQGAHFCAANAETLGVCVLGDYTSTSVPTPAVDALVRLGSFLSCEFDIEPLAQREHAPSGKTLYGFAAHQDGCATACPGEQLAGLMPTIRSAVDALSADGCATLAAPSDLTARLLSDGQVRLDWQADAGAELILIERALDPNGAFEVVASVAGDLTTFRDQQVTAGLNTYRVRVLRDGSLSPYSNTAAIQVSVSESTPPPSVKPRLVRNPVRGVVEVAGLQAPVDQAFISDAAGRTVKELKGSTPRWSLRPGSLTPGRYWLIIFSGNEWFSIPLEYRP